MSTHCNEKNRSATSVCATPHRGARSLSVDLTSFEISATGGRQRFAPCCTPTRLQGDRRANIIVQQEIKQIDSLYPFFIRLRMQAVSCDDDLLK